MNRTKESLESVTGRCNRTEDELSRTRKSLETVTTRSNRTEDELNRTRESLETVTTRSNRTEDELNRTRESLESVTGRCNRTEDELSRTRKSLETVTTRSNLTEEELNTCSVELTDTKSQLKGAIKFSNITMWDILYTESFYHKIFTGQLLDDLKSWSWDLLEEFVGVNVTEGVINHLQKHDVGKAECGAQISDILNMWDEFIGVKMTRGIIQHFKENHNDDPCDD
ncbi:uncharacterized protein LOC134819172 [Bolinopsis microptera]|uniref:uncharacterized protein LOC134819172 n=1 Tax=Bolinopsis microptera TaxID=2820187 RepID=UPI003079ED22